VIRDIWVLYGREVRSALRERTVVVNGILIPIFLYPVVLWAFFSAMVFVEGLAEGFPSRVALTDSVAAAGLATALGAHDQVELSFVHDREEARRRLEAGDLDALVEVEAAVGAGAALPGNLVLRVSYDRAEERSRRALTRVEAVADSLRAARLRAEARTLGMDTLTLRAFLIEWNNVSSGRDTGRMFLSILVPVFLTVMVALGCFIPAVDTTAGERERSTWETLWTTGPSRGAVVLSKYLFVATMGTVAGVLNVVAVSVALGGILRPLLGERLDAVSFALPAAALPLMLAGAVALALLFAAVMMVLAVFARSFKEGQAMVTPAYWLALAPLVLGSSPDRTLTPALALVPVANVAMAARDAIQARVEPGLVTLAFGVNLLVVVLSLMLAKRLVEREEVVTGSFEGSLWTWLRTRRRAGHMRTGER
jgi:sodium transport system permease protein